MAGTTYPSHYINYVGRCMSENNAGKVLVGANARSGKRKKANIEQLRKKDAQIVKGRFNNLEIPGGTLRFVYRKYEGDPVIKYELKDGEIYSIPVGVARHLNNDVGRYEHSDLLGADGKSSTTIRRRIRRCSFENLEFMDIEDIGATQIEEVTVLPSLS